MMKQFARAGALSGLTCLFMSLAAHAGDVDAVSGASPYGDGTAFSGSYDWSAYEHSGMSGWSEELALTTQQKTRHPDRRR